MNWEKVADELNRVADAMFDESMKHSGSTYPRVEQAIAAQQRSRDFGFLFRVLSNSLRKGLDGSKETAND